MIMNSIYAPYIRYQNTCLFQIVDKAFGYSFPTNVMYPTWRAPMLGLNLPMPRNITQVIERLYGENATR